jgi:hypothetical protein
MDQKILGLANRTHQRRVIGCTPHAGHAMPLPDWTRMRAEATRDWLLRGPSPFEGRARGDWSMRDTGRSPAGNLEEQEGRSADEGK